VATSNRDDKHYSRLLSGFAQILFCGNLSVPSDPIQAIARSAFNSLHPLNWTNPLGLLSGYSAPGMEKALLRAAARFDFDIVYLNGAMAHMLHRFDVPTVCDPHDALAYALGQRLKHGGFGPLTPMLGMQYLRTVLSEHFSMALADALIVVTELERLRLPSHLVSRTEIVPNGVDPEHFAPASGTAEGEKRLLYFGDLSAGPNIEAVVHLLREILPSLRARYPSLPVDLVGRNPTRELAWEAARAGATLVANVPDIRPYISSSTICVLPDYSGTGMKNKVLEAMAMGKPVVTTPVGARGISSDEREGVFVAEDDRTLLLHLFELLDSPSLALETGRRARELITREYTWRRATQILEKILRRFV
jgi:glycosyltransferase involved in cell wall biosynthesis